jgi:hypothetical protein
MTWLDGHVHELWTALPPGEFSFKIVAVNGSNLRWEGGANRVVQTEDEAGLPTEIVVWLTCPFDQTAATSLQLAVPRASVVDALENGKAALEMMERRKAKLGSDASQDGGVAAQQARSAEILRLTEAVAEQSTTIVQLGELLDGVAGVARAARPRHSGCARSPRLHAPLLQRTRGKAGT